MSMSSIHVFDGGVIPDSESSGGSSGSANIKNLIMRDFNLNLGGETVSSKILCDYDSPQESSPYYAPISIEDMAQWTKDGFIMQVRLESQPSIAANFGFLARLSIAQGSTEDEVTNTKVLTYERLDDHRIKFNILNFDKVTDEVTSITYLKLSGMDEFTLDEDIYITVEDIIAKVPSSASSTNKLVTDQQLDNATASMASGYTPKGPASVSTLNGLTGQENGDQYIVTDSGTLTDGSLAVTSGESVAWDTANEVWYKVNQYALKSDSTTEIRNLPNKSEGYLALNDANGTGKFDIGKIFNNFAGEFVPNSTTTVSGLPYMYAGVMYVAKVSGYQGLFDADKFEQVSIGNNFLHGAKRLSAGAFGNDLDELPPNTVYAVTDAEVGALFANKPNDENYFAIFTSSPCLAGAVEQCRLQVVWTSSYKRFLRTCWASDSWSGWIQLDNVLETKVMTSAPSAPYDDLNTFPANSVVLYTQNAGVANVPASQAFLAVTFSPDSSAVMQLVSTQDKRTYVRTKLGQWGNWTEIKNDLQLVVNPTIQAPYDNLDSFPVNSIVLVSSNAGSVSNKPSNELFSCFTYAANSAATVQILSTASKVTYIRSKWGSYWGEWVKLANEFLFVVNPTIQEPYNDLNTYPINSIVLVSSNAGSVSNKPTNELFSCFTYASNADATVQILSTASKSIFIRSKWSTSWGNWIELRNDLRFVVNPTIQAPYNDLDTYPINSIVLVSSGQSGVSNKPTNEAFSCFTYAANSAATVQILSTLGKKTYVRSKWGSSWGNWTKIDSSYNDVLCAFSNIVCIGDSLTYSQVYTSASASRQAYRPWPTVLGTITGAATFNLGNSGDSASDSWTRWKDSFESKANALAIIYLGTNHGLTDTLDTDAPASDPYTSWADTDTGCYAKIVAKLQELGYKILLVKPWAVSSPGVVATTQSVVDQIGSRFGCAVVGAISNPSAEFHYWPNGQGTNSTHMNDLGYSWFAHELVKNVSAIGDNLKYIIPS